MSDNTPKRRKISGLLNDHYARTQEQEHIQFLFSLVFNALVLSIVLVLLSYEIIQARDMTKSGLLLGLAIGILLKRIYKQAKETHQRALKLHEQVRRYDAAMSISDEASRNAALFKLVQDSVQAGSSMESGALFDEKPSLNNLLVKAIRNHRSG